MALQVLLVQVVLQAHPAHQEHQVQVEQAVHQEHQVLQELVEVQVQPVLLLL